MYSDTAVVKTQHRYGARATLVLVPCSCYTLPVLRGDGDSESPLRHWYRDTLPSPSPHPVSSPAQDRRPIVLYASPTHGLANRRPQRQTAGTHLVWHAMRACYSCRPARGRSFIIHYYLRTSRSRFLRLRLRSRTGLAARRASWDVMRTHTHQRSVRCVVARYDTRRPREPHTLQLRVRAPFFPVPIPPSPLPGLAWPRVGQDMRPAAVVVLVVAAMPTRTYTFCQDVETHRRQAATHLESITLLAPEQGRASGRVKLASSSSSSSSPPLPPLPPRALRVGKAPELPSSSFPISHQPVTATDTPEVQEAPRNAGIAWGGETGVYAGLPHPALVNAGPTGRRGPSAQPGCRATFVAGSGWLGGSEARTRTRVVPPQPQLQHIHIHIRVPISRLASGSVSGAFRALVAIAPHPGRGRGRGVPVIFLAFAPLPLPVQVRVRRARRSTLRERF